MIFTGTQFPFPHLSQEIKQALPTFKTPQGTDQHQSRELVNPESWHKVLVNPESWHTSLVRVMSQPRLSKIAVFSIVKP